MNWPTRTAYDVKHREIDMGGSSGYRRAQGGKHSAKAESYEPFWARDLVRRELHRNLVSDSMLEPCMQAQRLTRSLAHLKKLDLRYAKGYPSMTLSAHRQSGVASYSGHPWSRIRGRALRAGRDEIAGF